MNATYCTLLVQICQTSSAILRRLNSVQVVRESPEEMLRMIIELDGQLKFMKASMEPIIDLDQLIVPGNLPQSINITQALDLQFLYFGTVFNLHSSLANPWSISSLRSKGDPKLQEELRKCSWTAATAAKTAIMSTSLVRLDGTSSIPYVLCADNLKWRSYADNSCYKAYILHPHSCSDYALCPHNAVLG